MTDIPCPQCLAEEPMDCHICDGQGYVQDIEEDHDCVDYAEWDVYPKTWVCTHCNTIHDQFGDDE
jgi:hypothetical protein